MDVIQMYIAVQAQLPPQIARRMKYPTPAITFIGAGVKLGLYAGAAALVCRAIMWAATTAQARLSIPGGEVFTIPFIVALIASGYVLRGDVEANRRRKRRERRRQANEQRSH